MHRFFVETIQEEVSLEGEEFLHAKNVLRVCEGEEVVLLDNSAYEYTAVVTQVGKKSLSLHVLGRRISDKEPKTKVCLLFGYLKNADKNEFIVQKAVELGVSEIVAFSSRYSSAYMNENKLERLNKVAKEAAKQCGRSTFPKVVYEDLKGALEKASAYENKLFACEFATASEASMEKMHGSTALVVGSEGGFSAEEAELASAMGYRRISLGKRILRAETAAIALSSIVLYALGELQ